MFNVIKFFNDINYYFVVMSNQSGIGRGYYKFQQQTQQKNITSTYRGRNDEETEGTDEKNQS